MTATTLPVSMFLEALSRFGVDEVASNIGLNANTVARWASSQEVPSAYLPDFLRMLGLKGDYGDAKDQYFTRPETAEMCFKKFNDKLADLGVDTTSHTFVEPSMGEGGFYDLFPSDRRIGIDVEPRRSETVNSDFLLWQPRDSGRYIVVGNPPFGLRGHIALQFLNHSYQFADAVGFILPQCFGSDGKGAPGKRVKGYRLALSEDLRGDYFYRPGGAPVTINTVFQVWTKVGLDRLPKSDDRTCKDYVKVMSVSDGGTPSSTRNKKWIGKCDVYLPSTTFSGMKAYKRFDDLPNQRGYGIVALKERDAIRDFILRHNWELVAFPSTNSALNLRKSKIEAEIIKAGFTDK